MHIGITFDLRDEYLAEGYGEEATAEFDRADTIDAIAASLRELGHRVDRIGRARELVRRLAAGDRWELVFNICEGLKGVAREGQVPAILEVFDIPYTFADPLVMALCLHKGLAKLVVDHANLPTPRSWLVESCDDVQLCPLTFPVFAKPVAEGTGKGISTDSRITGRSELATCCQRLLVQFQQPVLVEEFLPGREFTVGVLGSGADSTVLGTLEIILRSHAEQGVYSYVNKERCEELVEYRLVRPDDPEVQQAEQTALAAWRALGCRDGGRIDLRSNGQGVPQFLEANPLAGLHPSHSDLPMVATALDIPYVELIRRIVESARERMPVP